MRVDIEAEDRVGITQDILSIFTQQNWNLFAMEMKRFHIFVHFDDRGIPLATLRLHLDKIRGVSSVSQVDLLPGERRRQHLDLLLSQLQELIFNLDGEGRILVTNAAVSRYLGVKEKRFHGKLITDYINEPLSTFLRNEPLHLELSLTGRSFQADINPVKSDGRITGAVLVMRTPQQLGQQISVVQQSADKGFDAIIGNSKTMIDLRKKARRFSGLDLPILITGETGTGKELLARAIHDGGSRADAPFLAVNCAALVESLLESELFGYAPGAFSGASRGGKPGLFELAAGGTLFLDEIGEMSVYMQAKLLRVLQDFTFRRVGSTQETTVDVRVISATHRNLQLIAEKKLFREDLYYRLNVLSLHLPPLRERSEDIPQLVQHFVLRTAQQINQQIPELTVEAVETLTGFPWPGNIRQLQNLLFRSIALSESKTMGTDSLLFSPLPDKKQLDTNEEAEGEVESWKKEQENFERRLLSRLYPHYPSTRKLADKLKVSHNKIAIKLRKYHLR